MRGYRHIVTIDLTDFDGAELATPEQSARGVKEGVEEALADYDVELNSVTVEYKETVTKVDEGDEEDFGDPDVEG